MLRTLDATYQPSGEERRLVETFAADATKLRARAYNIRHPAGDLKVMRDIIRGKLAEFAVYHWLRETTRGEPSQPDMNLYTNKEMTKQRHAADLTLGGNRIGVKSCRANDNDPSWVFQKSDPLDDDVYLLCVADENDGNGLVKLAWLVTPDVVLSYQKPLRNRAPSKVAVYHSDLLKLSESEVKSESK